MQIRFFWESDGRCFAMMADGCACLNGLNERCGTYLCPFYKPTGCKDWVRLDTRAMVRLFVPEELGERTWEKSIQEKKERDSSVNSQSDSGSMAMMPSVECNTAVNEATPM